MGIEAYYTGQLLAGGAIFILAAVSALALAAILDKSKSYYYRKYLTNMYVAGRIRQMADKDKLDLTKEEEAFLKYDSLSKRRRLYDLDRMIEEELAERISEDTKAKK